MALITNSVFIDLLLAVAPLIYYLFRSYQKKLQYWDEKGVPNVKKGILMDSLIGKQTQAETVRQIYHQFPDKKFVGLFQFTEPVLMIRDPELISKILVKDFIYFSDRGQPQVKHDPLSLSLFNLRGQVWRALRHRLTPTFSTGKLKGMFEQVAKCGDNMIVKLKEYSEKNVSIDSKAFLYEFNVDVISSCVFGLQFKPNSDEFNKFKTFAQRIFIINPFTVMRILVLRLFPKIAAIANLRFFPNEVGDYFVSLAMATFQFRKKNNIQRNDYFQLLLTLKEQEESGKDMGLTAVDAGEEDEIINQLKYSEQSGQPSISNKKLFTEDLICANTFVFLLAGSESTSSAMAFTLYQLSNNPDVQLRLQQEVDSVLAKNGNWSYEAIKDMPYLDQVIQETQRFFITFPLMMRQCSKSYKVPDSDLVIEKGTLVGIPTAALHMDPQYYPDPLQFRPERFEGNNFKPSATYLPFGDGPRICIAMRFALMEVKLCVARIVSQYTVKLSPKTQMPLQFEPLAFIPAVKGGLWLTFEKRTNAAAQT